MKIHAYIGGIYSRDTDIDTDRVASKIHTLVYPRPKFKEPTSFIMEEMSGLEKKLKQIYFNDIIYFYFYLHKLHPNSTMFFNKNNSETAFCICAMFIYFSLTHYQKPIKWL